MPIILLYSMIFFLFLFFVLEVKRLITRRAFKELIVAFLLLALAGVYGMDYVLNWKTFPNPNTLLFILQPASEVFENFFEISN